MKATPNTLDSPIQYIKGVGPKLAAVFAKKGITTFEDALYFLPRTYEDRRRLTPIGDLPSDGSAVTLLAKVVSSRQTRVGRSLRFDATVSDATGRLNLRWFRAYPSLTEDFVRDAMVLVHGDVSFFQGHPQIVHPDYEKITELKDGKPVASCHFGRIVPVYTEIDGLHQKLLRRIMAEVLRSSLGHLSDPLPEEMRQRLGLPTLRESFVALHFPSEAPVGGQSSAAVKRVIFEEFFTLQLGLGLKKRLRQRGNSPVIREHADTLTRFEASLPFTLTGDQKNAIAEIARDLSGGRTMTRLIQGDVGSGKTVVALAAAVLAAGEGYQTAIMAPTEILAQQHYATAKRCLAPLGIESVMLAAGAAGEDRKEVLETILSKKASLVIGTHALFQANVAFSRLGLVVVDEQHRFGVEQRGELLRKGASLLPHLLMMTATPIPRTLALTLYGDLDLTLIREKPAERKPVRTVILRDRERPRLYQRIRDAAGKGQQVYLIYPLVEQSEKLELKSATEMYNQLSREIFPDLPIALLHGRMKAEEKDRVLIDFKAGKQSILISTTVIEVGIDVPNATLMVIEHPERLGLSQLHQLRGRVGRGGLQSECILVADQYVGPRLKIMEATDDGFVIAEEDLKLRGPGEFLGTRQSGLPGFRVGHILRDSSLLSLAREEALKLLEIDPEMKSPSHAGIRAMVESRWKDKIDRLRGG